MLHSTKKVQITYLGEEAKGEVNIDEAFPELFLNKEELIWLPVTMVWQEQNYWIWVLSYSRGTRQKSFCLTSIVRKIFIFCTCLSRDLFYPIQMHTVFSDCPQPSPTGSAHLLVAISLFWVLFLNNNKKKIGLHFPKQSQLTTRSVTTLAGCKSGLLPSYLITPFSVEVCRVEKAYLPEQHHPAELQAAV